MKIAIIGFSVKVRLHAWQKIVVSSIRMLWAPLTVSTKNFCLQLRVVGNEGLLSSRVSHRSEPWWRKMRKYVRDSISSQWPNCRPWWLLMEAKVGVPTRGRSSCIGIWTWDDESWYFCVMPKSIRKMVSCDSLTPVRILCDLMSRWMKLHGWMYSRWVTYFKTSAGWRLGQIRSRLTIWSPIFTMWGGLNAPDDCRNKLCKEGPRLLITMGG